MERSVGQDIEAMTKPSNEEYAFPKLVDNRERGSTTDRKWVFVYLVRACAKGKTDKAAYLLPTIIQGHSRDGVYKGH